MSNKILFTKNMNIENKRLTELKPYDKNPRKNEDAWELVANSIQEFGFKVPIVIDKNNVIICGHTRYKAAEHLGLETVPCIVADDLTEEQVKAFRLADNSVAEKSKWDFDLLNDELNDILNIDMTDFNFEQIEEKEEPKENERTRTAEKYNMADFDESNSTKKYQMPIIEPTYHIPEKLIGFNYAKTQKDYSNGIHFFVDDYQFERVWQKPDKYARTLSRFDCVLTPDFSLYLNMAYPVKMWNVYRSRLIGQIFQNKGLTVIPTVQWADADTFDFCFEGLPKHSTLAVSTIGVKRKTENFDIWQQGMRETIKRLEPKTLICYGGKVDFDFGCDVVYIANEVTERMKKRGTEDGR